MVKIEAEVDVVVDIEVRPAVYVKGSSRRFLGNLAAGSQENGDPTLTAGAVPLFAALLRSYQAGNQQVAADALCNLAISHNPFKVQLLQQALCLGLLPY